MGQHGENGGGDAASAAQEPELYDYEDLPAGGGAGTTVGRPSPEGDPDVFLDVPELRVDEIDLDVEDLRARVSLQAEVLDLLKLNVGADVALGQVHLGISGVEAQARLKVRLDNVALIIDRVLTTLDRNPQIMADLVRRMGSAVQDLGRGAGTAVGGVGEAAGTAVEAVGDDVGEAVGEVGRGVGGLAGDVGSDAAEAVEEVGGAAGGAVAGAGDTTRRTGTGAGASAAPPASSTRRTPPADRPAGRQRSARAGSGAEDRRSSRRRRAPEDDAVAPRPTGRRGTGKHGEPP
ncbi:hypothetical protein [Streptomyces sp. NPDC005012]|uniref:hypothetical protein n=1 Tax=unclassified Streptomyces TaxID=2593676 RepID=UPI0033BCB96A